MTTKKAKVGHSIEEFQKQYNKTHITPEKIKEALKQLGESWMREIDFARFAGVGSQGINAHRHLFEDYIVEILTGKSGRRVWAGTKQLAVKLREMQK